MSQNGRTSPREPHLILTRVRLTGSVMTQCITVILRELESACEPAFAAILKTPWMHLDNVSGRSAYIVDLVGSIKQIAEVVRARLESKKYIRNFADKAVGWATSVTSRCELTAG